MELGMDYHQDEFNYCHYPMSPIHHYSFDGNFEDFSSSSYPVDQHQDSFINLPFEGISTRKVELERPKKQHKTTSQTSTLSKSASPYSSPQIISFESSSSSLVRAVEPKKEEGYEGIVDYPGLVSAGKRTGTPSRCPMLAKEHVISERKRREKLSERFIALSAVVPGLKKTDKASILGEAVKYVNHLQERVKCLEEQASRKMVESTVLMKRSYVYVDNDEPSSSDENSNNCTRQSMLPQVEARVSGKDVLIRIHCEMHKGGVAKILGEIEKFNLTVTNCSVIPFGCAILDVTVVAQMEANYHTSVKDLVRNLQQVLGPM